ncbi:MAG: DNA repair protein RecO [Acidobacteria bacterium]|nr:DNA repair protein RecO [Acidobacteriota bacterium]MCI0566696.1 DNA repair protein RecO [Acidobacteriota bacterium]
MPLLRTEGFVLRAYPLGEADKIVTFLTREEGKIRGVAKSARKSRRRFGSSLEPWSRVSLTYFEKEASELGRVDACDLLESAYRLHEDLDTAWLLAYMAEVADQFSRDRQAEPHYYRLLGSLLGALREGLPRGVALRYFEVWTLKLHGLLPDLSHCAGCEEPPGRADLIVDLASGSVLCQRCCGAEGPSRVALRHGGRTVLASILREHPSILASRKLPSAGLKEVGRLTSASLLAFVGAPFKTARFLSVAEEVAW